MIYLRQLFDWKTEYKYRVKLYKTKSEEQEELLEYEGFNI